jgi:DNA-binding LacI/PurR family transcriptional regulator
MEDGIGKPGKVSSPRRSAKRSRIVVEIRRQILEGEFAPGSRLPTRAELEDRFGVSSVTIQRSVDQLIEDGFVYARHRQGTYVAEYPPHLSHYGLVIPFRPTDIYRWSRFYDALCNESLALTSDRPRKVSVYYGVNERASENDYLALARDLETHRLAGLIFGSPPHHLAGTPIIETKREIPRVAITNGPTLAIPIVSPDWDSFVARATEYLNSRGRRRVAFVMYGPVGLDDRSPSMSHITGQRITAPPYWAQYAAQWPPQAAKNCVELLMRGPIDQRPDALVITDDNLVEQATAGLIAARVRVGQDLEVIAHTNFPWPTTSLVPAKRLGFDAREIIQRCLDVLEAQRKGERPPDLTLVPAIFEDELNR